MVAAGVGAVMAAGATGIALAADTPATAKVTDKSSIGVVFSSVPNKHRVGVPGITLTVNGKEVTAYCIDIGHHIDVSKTYTETGWTASEVRNLDKVKWILINSYPSKSPEALFQAAKVDKTGLDADALARLARVATQAAIWSFSDPDKFALLPASELNTVSEKDKEDAAKALKLDVDTYTKLYGLINTIYDHLRAGATKAAPESEPAPLSISPASASGHQGGKVGPFTVRSATGDVTLSATGGALVDKAGKPVTKVADKGEFWVTCTNAGTVKVNGKVASDVPLGRVFTVRGGENQKLILAGHAGKEQVANAAATCSATPGLPVTGAPVAGTIAAGFVMLGTGAGLFLLRRRRIRFTA